jgi:dienelactone hydrolase
MTFDTTLERAALVVASSGIAAGLFGPTGGWPALAIMAVAGAICAVRLATGPYRWQMVPAYLAVAGWFASTALIDEPGYLVAAGEGIGVAVAAVLTTGLPMPRLPPPDGPFAVGTISAEITRPAPRCTGPDTIGPRDLFVKVWYPADLAGAPRPAAREPLWPELHTAGTRGIPPILRALGRYLRRVPTHAHLAARLAAGESPHPVLIYNHGLVSFAADNTLLAESLASNGYLVVAVRHFDQFAEYRRVIALHDGTAVIVARRTADSVHVLDHLSSILERIPGYEANTRGGSRGETGASSPVRVDRVGAIGLSLGGAVATELSKTDRRIAAVVNLDGGLFGYRAAEPITVRYLMLYSQRNAGSNNLAAAAAADDVAEVTVAGAKHLDFHDAPAVLPILRWFGRLGPVSAAEMISAKAGKARAFLDESLQIGAR